jgi:hypothetical protein
VLAGIGCARASRAEPAAVTLVRLTDHPALRDVLLEGGAVRVAGGPAEPTRVEVVVTAAAASAAIPLHRATMLAPPPGTALDAGWAGEVHVAVRRGITSLLSIDVPGGGPPADLVELVPAPAGTPPIAWDVVPEQSSEPAEYPMESDYQMLARLVNRIAEPEVRTAYLQAVLAGAGPRDQWAPDHVRAIRSFVGQFWRCPWDGRTEPGPWREALSRILNALDAGASRGDLPRPEQWFGDGPWPKFDRDALGRLVMTHLPVDFDDVALEYRLLLPVGSILVPGGVVVLDEAPLDGGFVLA